MDIKTSFDRIMDTFNDTMTPKTLNFEFTKKRRLSLTCEETPNNSQKINNNSTTEQPPPPSPWEFRRVKADFIESQSKISKLKQEIERQYKIRNEMETLYESKVIELKKQCDFSSDKILDLEKHMQLLRKREYAAKTESTNLQKEVIQMKNTYDDMILTLQRSKQEIEENAQLTQNSLTNELSEYRRLTEKLDMDINVVTEELSHMKALMDEYKSRANAYDQLKPRFEKERQALEQSNSRIKELEYEIASYVDWKEITKNSQARLCSIPNKDKEIERLKTSNKNLQDLVGNKLLLEEQVHDLQTRLQKNENAKTDAVTLQVKLAHAERELKEWLSVAQDHCPPNTLVSPIALRSRIELILQNDIIIASEKGSNVSQTKAMESKLEDWQQKCEIYMKKTEELHVALQRHKNWKDRMQRKIAIVSRERDLYKNLLENIEKDSTLSNSNVNDASIVDSQLRLRVDMLEKTLSGYKDMCVNMEKELVVSRQTSGGDQALDSLTSTESYEHLRRDIEALRLENDRLNRRKEELELEMEHRFLKGDFNVEKYKVIHMAKNPAAEAYENSKDIVEKLQAEIERLKRRNQKLEEENELSRSRMSEATDMTFNIKEINQMRAELELTNNRMKTLKEHYRVAGSEFRDVCYMLFGYRVDRNGNNYKLISMYAESPDDYLNFRLNESNTLDMIETSFSQTLKALIESQLIANKSLPAFLSAVTLDLFQRTTMTIA